MMKCSGGYSSEFGTVVAIHIYIYILCNSFAESQTIIF